MSAGKGREFWVQPLAFCIMLTLGLSGLRTIHGALPQFLWILGSAVVGGLVALAAARMVRWFRRHSEDRDR